MTRPVRLYYTKVKLSSYFLDFYRNGKIDRSPLRVKRLVVLSREKYERIKGIAGIKCKRILRKRINKKLSAKTEKVNIVKDSHIDSSYIPSHIVYVRKAKPQGWWRVNEWFKELKSYYDIAPDEKTLEKNIGTE